MGAPCFLNSIVASCICRCVPRCTGGNFCSTGVLHGNFTPPRISPSCPHGVKRWLGRSLIITDAVIAVQPRHEAVSWTDGPARTLLAVIDAGLLHRWSWRILQSRLPPRAARQLSYAVSGYSFVKVQREKVLSYRKGIKSAFFMHILKK